LFKIFEIVEERRIKEKLVSEVIELAALRSAQDDVSLTESDLIDAGVAANIPAHHIQQAIIEIEAKHQKVRARQVFLRSILPKII
jgi:hypothetical protein